MDEMNGKAECDELNGITRMKELTCSLVYVNKYSVLLAVCYD